jgi:hypothetical protein
METKLLEIRDAGTLIPALAIKISGADGYLARRAGFNAPMIYLVHLTSEKACYDPYSWPSGAGRTMQVAHLAIENNWESLRDHDVVDVEFILGLRDAPKVSESVGR